jgi:hypothetical protein
MTLGFDRSICCIVTFAQGDINAYPDARRHRTGGSGGVHFQRSPAPWCNSVHLGWLVPSLIYGAFGVTRAGIPIINEIGAFVPIFGIPAALACICVSVSPLKSATMHESRHEFSS